MGVIHHHETGSMICGATGAKFKMIGACTCIREENKWIFFADTSQLKYFINHEKIRLMNEKVVYMYENETLRIARSRNEGLKMSNLALYKTLEDLEEALMKGNKKLLRFLLRDDCTEYFIQTRDAASKVRGEVEEMKLNNNNNEYHNE